MRGGMATCACGLDLCPQCIEDHDYGGCWAEDGGGGGGGAGWRQGSPLSWRSPSNSCVSSPPTQSFWET